MMYFDSRENARWSTVILPLLTLTGALCLPAKNTRAEGTAKRFPVTPEMVVSAMEYRQLPVEGVQVRLSAPITASSSNPMLDIQTMTMVGVHSAQLRVACRVHAECLPFYVAATWPDAHTAMTIPGELFRPSVLSSTVAKAIEAPAQDALKPGSTATLLIEDQKVHIQLQVICLEGGIAGDKVRVATPDHRLAYKAEIVAPNLLKGSF